MKWSELTGADREAQEEIEFYCSGVCRCGHPRGSHDYPAGRCMEPGCRCKALVVAAEREAKQKGREAA